MTRFVVSYINFFDNNLISKIVEAEDDRSALLQGCYELSQVDKTKVVGDFSEDEFFADLSGGTIEDIKQAMFDVDMACDVIEVPT
jgi:hypothetical protein